MIVLVKIYHCTVIFSIYQIAKKYINNDIHICSRVFTVLYYEKY